MPTPGEDQLLQLHEFREFLEETQKEWDISEEELKSIAQECKKWDDDLPTDEDLTMGVYGFAEYLRSYASVVENVQQDMTRPLTDYWIASSHNTYLDGAQV